MLTSCTLNSLTLSELLSQIKLMTTFTTLSSYQGWKALILPRFCSQILSSTLSSEARMLANLSLSQALEEEATISREILTASSAFNSSWGKSQERIYSRPYRKTVRISFLKLEYSHRVTDSSRAFPAFSLRDGKILLKESAWADYSWDSQGLRLPL